MAMPIDGHRVELTEPLPGDLHAVLDRLRAGPSTAPPQAHRRWEQRDRATIGWS